MSHLKFYKVELTVCTPDTPDPKDVHEALCRYLHEEVVSFTHEGNNIEFTNVGQVFEVCDPGNEMED